MARNIKFAIRIHQGGYDYSYIRDIFRKADVLGYHAASLYDLLNIPTLECWTTLSALAAETKSLKLIPMVLANLYRHPSITAKMAATLDVISGGRMELGIGAGGGERDHQSYGFNYPSVRERAAMLSESVQIIEQLWTGDRSNFQGRFYKLTNAICQPPPVQQPKPPILIGGHGETHLMRVLASHGDISNMQSDLPVAEHRRKRTILERYCSAIGRDVNQIECSHNARIFISENSTSLNSVIENRAKLEGKSFSQFQLEINNSIVGTPEDCIRQIQTYTDYGISYFFLLFPEPINIDSIQLFAEKVMPYFSEN